MKLLVTDSAGFIGSRVAELLLQSGHCVVGVDNLNDAYDTRLKEWRLSRLSSEPGFRFQRLDITDHQAMAGVFSQDSFDALINLAARAGVRQSLKDPWTYYSTNLNGTLKLLELCRENRVTKFILASTSSVYGNDDSPFSESN